MVLLDNKIAVITGASSGIGLETALVLAEAGYTVLATMRDITKRVHLEDRAEQLNVKHHIIVEQLDVTKRSSIENFKLTLANYKHVDILVNNAGFAQAGFVEEVSLQEYREQFETNFFGLVAMTKLVIPFMRKQGSGKIINISSISGLIGFPGISPYCASKHAVEGFSKSLRLELKPRGVDVVLIEPGSYKTNIWSSGKKIAAGADRAVSSYSFFMDKIEERIEKNKAKFEDPKNVALLVLFIINKKNPKLHYPIGKGVKTALGLTAVIPWRWIEKYIVKFLLNGETEKK